MKALNAKKYGKTKNEKVEMEAFEKKHRHRDIENQSSSYETEEKSNLKMKQVCYLFILTSYSVSCF